ncbi:odorant receptor 85b-like isoform X2 [Prorops nasuta]|uniref:odorant receptor 85b-like isoform X2 n=1 Tax=Prorops nasuta TaxID=863751 RepID=UPI0034CDFFF7
MDESQIKFVSELPDCKEFYSLHKKLLKIIYQWPGQNPLFRKVFIWLSTVMTAAALTGVITEMNNFMFDDWNNIYFRGETKIFQKYGKYARIAAQFITGYIFITAVVFLSVAIPAVVLNVVKPLNESRIIPTVVEMEFGINQANHQIPYLIYTYITVWCSLSNIVCYDIIYSTYLIHNTAMFNITGYTFEYLLYNRNEEAQKNFDDEKRTLRAVWERALNFHHRALQFNFLFENTFTYPCAIELIMCTLQSSLSMIHVMYSLERKEYHETVRYAVFVISQFVRLFINVLPGQLLMNSSNNLYTSIYNGNWNFLPLKYQKMIVIVLTKARKTTYVTASKLFILGFEIFTVWVKTVVSYFAIALSLQRQSNLI